MFDRDRRLLGCWIRGRIGLGLDMSAEPSEAREARAGDERSEEELGWQGYTTSEARRVGASRVYDERIEDYVRKWG